MCAFAIASCEGASFGSPRFRFDTTGFELGALGAERVEPQHQNFFFFKQKTAYEISECDWSSDVALPIRSEEHTSELQSHSEISYAVFCLKKKKRHLLNIRLYTPSTASLQPSLPSLFEYLFFFFNDTATTEIYTNLNTLSLHDALPI